MSERKSSLRSDPRDCKSSKVNPDLLRVMLTVLSLKNLELNKRGFRTGNQPDIIWYESQLNQIGIQASLLQIHHNLRRLTRCGILNYNKEIVEYGFKGQSKIFNRYTPALFHPSSLTGQLWNNLLGTFRNYRLLKTRQKRLEKITCIVKLYLQRYKIFLWRWFHDREKRLSRLSCIKSAANVLANLQIDPEIKGSKTLEIARSFEKYIYEEYIDS